MAEAYVAARRLRVGNEFREPGDLVPEAASWPTLRELVQGGYLQLVTDIEGSFHPEGFGWHADPSGVKVVSIAEWERLKAMEQAIMEGRLNPGPFLAPDRPESGGNPENSSQGGSGASTGLSVDAGMDPRLASPAQIIKFVKANPEMAETILTAEQSGKNRKSVVDAIMELATNPGGIQ